MESRSNKLHESLKLLCTKAQNLKSEDNLPKGEAMFANAPAGAPAGAPASAPSVLGCPA